MYYTSSLVCDAKRLKMLLKSNFIQHVLKHMFTIRIPPWQYHYIPHIPQQYGTLVNISCRPHLALPLCFICAATSAKFHRKCHFILFRNGYRRHHIISLLLLHGLYQSWLVLQVPCHPTKVRGIVPKKGASMLASAPHNYCLTITQLHAHILQIQLADSQHLYLMQYTLHYWRYSKNKMLSHWGCRKGLSKQELGFHYFLCSGESIVAATFLSWPCLDVFSSNKSSHSWRRHDIL